MAPRGGIGTREATQDRRREPIEQDAGDPVPEPQAVALGGIVEQGRAEEVAIVVPASEQPAGHVEAVAPIGHWHGGEEPDAALGQDATHERLLLRLDARTHVGDELRDPMHRSAPA